MELIRLLQVEDHKVFREIFSELVLHKYENIQIDSNKGKPVENILFDLDSKNYDMVLLDIGLCSLGERPYWVADKIKELRPGVVLIGTSPFCEVERQLPEEFDGFLLKSGHYMNRFDKLLEKHGFEVKRK